MMLSLLLLKRHKLCALDNGKSIPKVHKSVKLTKQTNKQTKDRLTSGAEVAGGVAQRLVVPADGRGQ